MKHAIATNFSLEFIIQFRSFEACIADLTLIVTATRLAMDAVLHPPGFETIEEDRKYFCMNGKTNIPLDINAMALFARVLQHGSLSEASRRLGVPVSTVSRKIGALERELGVRLLERQREHYGQRRAAAIFCRIASKFWMLLTVPVPH